MGAFQAHMRQGRNNFSLLCSWKSKENHNITSIVFCVCFIQWLWSQRVFFLLSKHILLENFDEKNSGRKMQVINSSAYSQVICDFLCLYSLEVYSFVIKSLHLESLSFISLSCPFFKTTLPCNCKMHIYKTLREARSEFSCPT